MFEYIAGKLVEKSPVFAVVDCGGVGYLLSITLNTYDALPDIGKPATLFAYLVHRDDSMELFGFATWEERDSFKKLMTVTRVGPKLALSILSGTKPRELALAITAGDIVSLSKIPKVGRKTAERIVMELREKIDLPPAIVGADDNTRAAIDALVALGFGRAEAMDAISRAQKNSQNATADELIRAALGARNA